MQSPLPVVTSPEHTEMNENENQNKTRDETQNVDSFGENGNQNEDKADDIRNESLKDSRNGAVDSAAGTVKTEGTATGNETQSVGDTERAGLKYVEQDKVQSADTSVSDDQNGSQDPAHGTEDIQSNKDGLSERADANENLSESESSGPIQFEVGSQQSENEAQNESQKPEKERTSLLTESSHNHVQDQSTDRNGNQSTNQSDTQAVSQDKSPFKAPPYERRDTLNSLFQESYERSISESTDEAAAQAAPSPWYFLYCRLSQSSQQNGTFSVIGMKIPLGNGAGRSTGVEAVRTWFVFAIPKRRLLIVN